MIRIYAMQPLQHEQHLFRCFINMCVVFSDADVRPCFLLHGTARGLQALCTAPTCMVSANFTYFISTTSQLLRVAAFGASRGLWG